MCFIVVGDAGYSFYFILSGGVTVEVTDKDEKTGEDMTQVGSLQ